MFLLLLPVFLEFVYSFVTYFKMYKQNKQEKRLNYGNHKLTICNTNHNLTMEAYLW